jgi:hypothetical protein
MRICITVHKMTSNHAIRFGSSRFVDDVLEVRSVTKRAPCSGQNYFLAIVTNRARQYEAIAGPPAAKLTIRQTVHVHGCFLLRRGEPVVVVCSLKPVSETVQVEPEGPQWK